MYHRVAGLPRDPWGLAVSPGRFGEQMRLLARRRTPLAMADFVARLRAGTLPRDAVAVTFDDGYVDNMREAEPALAAAGVPATLFVATGAIDRNERFWWDELAVLILERREPFAGHLRVGAADVEVAFGAVEPEDAAPSGWRAWQPALTARQAAFLSLWRQLQSLAPHVRAEALAGLRAALGPVPQPGDDRAMSAAELRGLAARGTFALGGHTINHPALPALTAAEQQVEVRSGREHLEALAGVAVGGFAYPYGAVGREARRAAESAGFAWACTTEKGAVDPRRYDLHALPRLAVGDWDAPRLEREMLGA